MPPLSQILGFLSTLSTVLADCSREFLRNATNAYILTQQNGLVKTSDHDTAFSSHLSPNIIYIENFTPIALNTSILSTALSITHNFSMHDTTTCSTFTELVILPSNGNANPYIFHTRMLLNSTTSELTTINSLLTTTGDWAFNITGYLHYATLEPWDSIPVAKQDSRVALQAIADAYFNRFNDSAVVVPWGAPCYAVEGGTVVEGMLEGGDCVMSWPMDRRVVDDRRYVIDEVLGAVAVFDRFPGLDSSHVNVNKEVPDSRLFRIEGGKIRFLHTASHCLERGCGVNGTSVLG